MLNYTRTRDAIWSADFRLRAEYENTDPLKHLRWRALQQYLTKLGINYCYKALHLSCLQGSWLCVWITKTLSQPYRIVKSNDQIKFCVYVFYAFSCDTSCGASLKPGKPDKELTYDYKFIHMQNPIMSFSSVFKKMLK